MNAFESVIASLIERGGTPEAAAIRTIRAALQALVHELYFKSSHFAGLRGHSPRHLHDTDQQRYEAMPASELLGNSDPITALLEARLARIPGADFDSLVDNWQRAESTLNARVRMVFGLLGPGLPAELAQLLVGAGDALPSLNVVAGQNPIGGKRSDKRFGQPDLVLLGDDTAVTIEMKVRGGKATARYAPLQHCRYLLLGEALRQQMGLKRVHHVLLAPFSTGRIVDRAESWLHSPVEPGSTLVPSFTAMIDALPADLRDELQAQGGESRLATLSAEVPTRLADLGDLLDTIERVISTQHPFARHLADQVAKIRRYGLRKETTMQYPGLGRINATRRAGQESFHAGGEAKPWSLLDFWAWSVSDLVSNVTRGRLAEYVVAQALGVDTSGVRDEWAAYDLVTPDGIKVEVKSAAFLQSWHQDRLSSISFRTPKTREWDATTNALSTDSRRQADVYVFALLTHTDKATVDPLDLDQWHFWAVPTSVLDARTRSQHSITLSTLKGLAGAGVGFQALADEMSRVLDTG